MANIITERYFRFNLPEGKRKERIDVYLTNSLENATRTRVQKLIESGFVTVNGKIERANYQVKPGDEVLVTLPVSPRPEKAEPEDIPIEVVYEDEYLLIVNKPAGIVVHPSFGNYTGTLVNALLHHADKLSDAHEDPARPGIVHRIDKDTSGLLVVAKDEVTHAKLAAQFSRHTIERQYQAVVWGRLRAKEGTVDTYICRSKKDRKKFMASVDEGKHAITHYTVLEEYEFLSLIALKLETGRTHQIRVHMSHLGHPIFGDETYGGCAILAGHQLPKIRSRVDNLLEIVPRQALHAKTLGFMHPRLNQFMRFDSDLPPDMAKLIELVSS